MKGPIINTVRYEIIKYGITTCNIYIYREVNDAYQGLLWSHNRIIGCNYLVLEAPFLLAIDWWALVKGLRSDANHTTSAQFDLCKTDFEQPFLNGKESK